MRDLISFQVSLLVHCGLMLLLAVWGWETEYYAIVNATALLIIGPANILLWGYLSDRWTQAGMRDAPFRIMAAGLLIMVPTLLVISIVTFLIIQAPPGDYLTNMIQELRAQGEASDFGRTAMNETLSVSGAT